MMSKLVSASSLHAEAVNRLGQEVVDERVRIADEKAERCKLDLTCFPEDEDRGYVGMFCQHRFRQIALAMGGETFEKFKGTKHDVIFVFMLECIEKGRLI